MTVSTIDSSSPGLARHTATFLLREGDQAAFVETNTNQGVPGMLAALRAEGLSPESVSYVIITHVHLDHAGGASQLMGACPNATLLAHPKAAIHAIDPSRLVKSAREVYGEERFAELFGEIGPIPEGRVRAMEDGAKLPFGSRELTFTYTRGHANHHFVVHDSRTNGVFTGDSFGIVYPSLQSNGLFAFPSTTPTDFDADEAKKSINTILGMNPDRVYLTHFGMVRDVEAVADRLLAQVDTYGALVDELYEDDQDDDALGGIADTRVRKMFDDLLRRNGLQDDKDAQAFLELDVDINAQGIAFAAKKRRFKEKRTT